MSKSSHGRWLSVPFKIPGVLLLAGAGLIAMSVVPRVSAQVIPADPQLTCTVSAPVFAGWFETGTPALNGVVKPANSVTFPNSPNCSFYQWSEQMFLWLTSPAPKTYGGGGGRIFNSPAFYDVSPLDATGHRTLIPHVPGRFSILSVRAAKVGPHKLPVITDRAGRMFEVEPPKLAPSGRQLILNQAGKPIEIERATIEKGRAVFLDKAGKAITAPKPVLRAPQLEKIPLAQKFVINGRPVFLDSFGNVIDTEEGQADGGVLEARNGSLIYSTIVVNDVYAYFLTGVRDHAIVPGTFFPTTPADLNQITTFASSHGKTFPDSVALAIEVKASWIEAAGLPNPNDYITIQATIPTYNKANPAKWVPNGQKTVQLALLGMHVVGSAKGHPELIWATFEHFGVAPNAAYAYNSTTGPKTVAQNTAGTWLLAATGSAGPFNVMHMRFNSPNIEAISPHTISPSDTLRMKPWGGASNASPNPLDPTVAASNTEIISINNSVRSKMAAGDVRNNYFMTGATWTIGGAPPVPFPNTNFGNPGNPGGNAVGTSQLNNTTMETYQQGTTAFVAGGSNCFFCHTSNTTAVSHIFPDLKPLF